MNRRTLLLNSAAAALAPLLPTVVAAEPRPEPNTRHFVNTGANFYYSRDCGMTWRDLDGLHHDPDWKFTIPAASFREH